MLTGPELGRAIDGARKKKGMTKAALAQHFGVKPPSVQNWIKRGTIDKSRLPALWALFQDVVGPEHWGLPEGVRMAFVAEDDRVVMEPASFYGDDDLLERFGMLLARVPPAQRTAFGRLLDGWASEGGPDHYRAALLALLRDPSAKRRAAGE